MGQNLARNVARNGFPIAVHNRTASKVDEFLEAYGSEGAFTGAHTLTEFVEKLAAPRTILIMVKAGGPVDAVIEELVPLLAPGDTIVDGGKPTMRIPSAAASISRPRALTSSESVSQVAKKAR